MEEPLEWIFLSQEEVEAVAEVEAEVASEEAEVVIEVEEEEASVETEVEASEEEAEAVIEVAEEEEEALVAHQDHHSNTTPVVHLTALCSEHFDRPFVTKSYYIN
jgi:hypothetical protein